MLWKTFLPSRNLESSQTSPIKRCEYIKESGQFYWVGVGEGETWVEPCQGGKLMEPILCFDVHVEEGRSEMSKLADWEDSGFLHQDKEPKRDRQCYRGRRVGKNIRNPLLYF